MASRNSRNSKKQASTLRARNNYINEYFKRPEAKWSLESFSDYLFQRPEYDFSKANVTKFWIDHLKKLVPRSKHAKHLLGQYRKSTRAKILFKGCNVGGENNIVYNYSQASDSHVSNSHASDSHASNSDVESDEVEDEETENVELKSDLPIASWKSATKSKSFLSFLKYSIIDLDGLARIDSKSYSDLQSRMLKLTQNNSNLEYALGRFQDCKDRDDFIRITETCPRPPEDPINENNFICTYANRAVSHWISHCQRIPHVKHLLKEGNYDIIWSNIIDDLWSDDPLCLVLLRKEIFSHVGGPNRHDGVFRYHDGAVAFDVGVAEASIPAVNPNNDAKGDNDLSKVYLAMANMLRDLTERVRSNEEFVRKLQVFGMVTSGLTLRIYRMQWVDSSYCVVKSSDPFVLDLAFQQKERLFNIFRVLAKVKVAMKETVDLVLRGSRHTVSF